MGWLHGPCIALTDAGVASGTSVMIVTLGDPQQLAAARIKRRAAPGDHCPALNEDRRSTNLASGLAFYLVEPADAVALAIGMVGPPSAGVPTRSLNVRNRRAARYSAEPVMSARRLLTMISR